MKPYPLLITLFSFTIASAQTDVTLKPTEILAGKCTILVPETFGVMSEEILAVKYPNEARRPAVVYTNPEANINVAFNLTPSALPPEDLPKVKAVLDAQFKQMEGFKSEDAVLNGSKFVLYEFVSPAVDTQIYNHMAVGSLDGKLFIVTFNCVVRLREEWEPIGKKVIQSITVK